MGQNLAGRGGVVDLHVGAAVGTADGRPYSTSPIMGTRKRSQWMMPNVKSKSGPLGANKNQKDLERLFVALRTIWSRI